MGVNLAALERARLVAYTEEGALFSTLAFEFNPTDLKTTREATWNKANSKTAALPEYISSGPQRADLTIFLDEWSNPAGDVSKTVNKLISWTKPTRESKDKKARPKPPIVELQWGRSQALANVQWYITRVAAEYTVFRADGTPIRASCQVALTAYQDDRKTAQNPTSGSLESRRSRVLAEGDSLAALAFREYGKASLWRALALFNGIDDPFDVPPGTRVLVPSMGEAHQLERDGG
jgi:hypothetical protein